MAQPEPGTEDSDDAIRSWAKLPRRDKRAMQSGPADGDFKLELMKHLSREVEMAQHQLIAQRSKNNLLVAFGPYLATKPTNGGS